MNDFTPEQKHILSILRFQASHAKDFYEQARTKEYQDDAQYWLGAIDALNSFDDKLKTLFNTITKKENYHE